MTEPSKHARECAKLIEDSLMVYPLGVEKGLRMFSVLGAVQDCLDAATAELKAKNDLLCSGAEADNILIQHLQWQVEELRKEIERLKQHVDFRDKMIDEMKRILGGVMGCGEEVQNEKD